MLSEGAVFQITTARKRPIFDAAGIVCWSVS
jgi:hypothetical protein